MKLSPPTPGPWQVEEHAPLRDGQYYLEVATPPTMPDGGYPMLICTVQPTATDGSRGPDPEQRANAALLAAAPDLLHAATQALATMEWAEANVKGTNLQSDIILLRRAVDMVGVVTNTTTDENRGSE